MNKKKYKKILVVLGGTSGERTVSLASGKACMKALKKKKYSVSSFDPKKKNFNQIDRMKVDAIFNALHGKDGEDGIAQSFFEYLKIPYTHSGVISSYNAMDKLISKKIFRSYKILTPNYFSINKKYFTSHNLKNLIIKNKLKFPLVIKPINEGSSLGVKICKNLKILKTNTKNLFKTYDKLMIEQHIGGQEVQVAVINGNPLGAIELIPKRLFYDYKAKYTKAAKTKHIMPARLTRNKYREVLRIAKKTHRALDCKGVTRTDFKFYKK